MAQEYEEHTLELPLQSAYIKKAEKISEQPAIRIRSITERYGKPSAK